MVGFSLNILIKELDLELGAPKMPDVEVYFSLVLYLHNTSTNFLTCHSLRDGAYCDVSWLKVGLSDLILMN